MRSHFFSFGGVPQTFSPMSPPPFFNVNQAMNNSTIPEEIPLDEGQELDIEFFGADNLRLSIFNIVYCVTPPKEDFTLEQLFERIEKIEEFLAKRR